MGFRQRRATRPAVERESVSCSAEIWQPSRLGAHVVRTSQIVCATLLAFLACQSAAFAGQSSTAAEQSTGTRQPATTQNYNMRLEQLAAQRDAAGSTADDYRIGANDLLDISVYNAPDLNRTARVSATGSVSLPLIGDIQAAGSTAKELEARIESLLRQNYMTNPQVGVSVKEIQSHPVSVFGAVGRPGVYQIPETVSLIQVLSLAQGLADDAGDKVIIMRRGGIAEEEAADAAEAHRADSDHSPTSSAIPEPASSARNSSQSVQINLKELLSSANPAYNVEVHPEDVVKVPPAGIVYVVGEVHKPGGFLMRTNENISVLQALALAEGTTSTSSEKGARIIRTDAGGEKEEIRIDLKRILAGKAADPLLQSKDILFIPNSAGKSAFYRGAEAALSITGGLIVYRR